MKFSGNDFGNFRKKENFKKLEVRKNRSNSELEKHKRELRKSCAKLSGLRQGGVPLGRCAGQGGFGPLGAASRRAERFLRARLGALRVFQRGPAGYVASN